MNLKGRVAIVTGASSGIGLAVAQQLAREGVAVVMGARRLDRLIGAAQEIRARGGYAEAVKADVTSETDVEALVEHARQAFGRLDIMICNAGFGYYGTVEETPAKTMRRMMDVNFMGTFNGARAALPLFRQARQGHLLIVSSIVGQRGIAQMSGYSATKAAQAAFAEALRAEFVGSGIDISVVYPVSTDTEFKDAIERDFGYSVAGLGPKQSAEDVARAIVACVKRPKPAVYPHRLSRALTIVNAIAPGFADRLVRKYGRRRVTR